jgi:RHS repeat-associated protein
MTTLIHLYKNGILAVALVILLAGPVNSQTTAARPDRGFMPGASYSVSDVENISLTNGNVNLTIPLASLPPIAGGKLSLTLSAIYNSKLWNITRHENQGGTFNGCPNWVVDTPQVSDVGGWVIGAGYRITFRDVRDDFDYAIPETAPGGPYGSCENDYQEYLRLFNNWRRAVLVGPDGAEHELRPTDGYLPYGGNARSYLFNYYKDTPDTINAPMRYYSFDGSFLWAVVNPSSYSTRWTLYMKDGTRVVQLSNGIQRITDTNGNSIKIYSDTEGTHFQDEQTGREIKYTYDPSGNNGKGQGHVLYQTVGGTWKSIDINFDVTRVQGKVYRVNGWQEWGGETGGGMQCWHDNVLLDDLSVIRDIIFPVTEPGQAARKYSFGYNSDTTTTATDQVQWACGMAPQSYTRTVSTGMGSLSQMVTPSGATVQYTYSRDGRHTYGPLGGTDDIPRETLTQKTLTHDGVTDTWSYSIYEFAACGGTVTAPDGSVTIESCYPHDAGAGAYNASLPKGGLVFRSNRSNKQLIERHWSLLPFSGGNTGATGNWGSNTFNPVVDAEYITLLDDTPNHNPVKMSAKTYAYDYNGNMIQETNYDWFDPSLVTRDSGGEPTGVPASATVLRVVNHNFYNGANSASSGNVYAKRSLSTATPLILNAAQQTTLGQAITQFSYDGQSYGVAPTVGNLTSWSVWDDLGAHWITTSNSYGLYGNLATSTDARGKVTQFFYDDSTHALPNRMIVDPQNATGTQTSTTNYDYYTGLVTNTIDENGNTTTIDYTNQLLGAVDPFGRPGVTSGPQVNIGGVNQRRRVTNTYLDAARQVIVESDLNSENDRLLKTRQTSDMLGRVVLTEQTEDGVNYTVYTRKAYEQMGRITYASNAMRYNVSSNTDGWTRVTNDDVGRVTEVATFGGVNQPAATGTGGIYTGSVSTSYVAETTTITDQAGKQRKSVVDALGRVVKLYEDPANLNYLTTYDYDVFGNLRHVYQGVQTRTFNYDSLSRLRSAVNPESGTITYTYDDNGNLLTRTDARGVVSTYVYDALNRPTTRSYSDGTPTVTYTYDAAAVSNSKGKLTAVSSSVSSYNYSGFDAMGRVNGGSQVMGSQTYTMSYTYDLAGHTKAITYPSGRTVSYGYDNAGRTNSMTGTLGDGLNRNYTTGIAYDAGSRMTQEQFGTTTPVYNKLFYTSRGQLAEIRAGLTPNNTNWERGAIINFYGNCWGMCAGQSMPNNNGNLLRQEHWIQNDSGQVIGIPTQEFDYDSLNRLRWVKEGTGWKQQYSYDRYGNRLVDQNPANTFGDGIPKPNFGLDTNTNRLTAPSGYTMTYDSAGNLTNDNYTGQGQRTYDAENRMKQAWANNQWQTYSYDGDGRRVKRLVNGVETWQVYGLGGELLAEYAANAGPAVPQKEYAYRNGQLLVSATTPVGSGTGLQAQYFDNMNFTNLKVTRTDATVNVDWGGGTPDGSIGVDTFTTRWTGKVEPQYSQTYTFYTQTDDGVRLWVNGQLIIDKWIDQGPTEWSGQITLTAGQRYDIRMDFYENGGGAMATLSWSSASQAKQIIPQSRLYLPGNTSQVSFNWVVADQLGTPRIVLDQTGSLSGVSRHDYLPFGEELFAAGRTPQLGFTGGDGTRQKFTSKERDDETGLDYFGARYYGSNQGRFTSTDPLMASGRPNKPQSWNRYAYVLNNPLILIDPDGMQEKNPEQQVVDIGKDQIINKKIQEIEDNAKPLAQGTAPVPTQAVVIPGEQTQLNNAKIIDSDGNTVASGVSGYMQPIALVVLDQGGNIMKAPNDMFVVESAKPANEAAEELAKSNRQVTSNEQERGQANNGAFYDLQIRGSGKTPQDIRTTQDVTVRHYFGPKATDYKEIFKITGNKIRFDDHNRRITFNQGQVKKL